MIISLHAKLKDLWLDNDKNINQECLQTCTMSTPLIRVFFLEMQFGGGKLFLWGRENRKNFQNQTKFGIVFKTPLKGLIKKIFQNK